MKDVPCVVRADLGHKWTRWDESDRLRTLRGTLRTVIAHVTSSIGD
jgi:hypothetical protein